VLVCWDWGDRYALREIERQGYHNFDVEFNLDENSLSYSDDDNVTGTIEVIPVQSRLHRTELVTQH
jgi:hypothetical protein